MGNYLQLLCIFKLIWVQREVNVSSNASYEQVLNVIFNFASVASGCLLLTDFGSLFVADDDSAARSIVRVAGCVDAFGIAKLGSGLSNCCCSLIFGMMLLV